MTRLLYILVFSVCIDGTVKHNFTVVVVTADVKDERGSPIRALSSLPAKTTIHVPSNGYIALVDVSNNLFEFRGPASITLQKLVGRSRGAKFTPDLAKLYADSIQQKAVWNERNDASIFIAPLGYSQSFAYSGDTLCLEWLRKAYPASIPARYARLFVTDEFGDTVMTSAVAGNRYCYAFPQENKKQKFVYVIGIQEKQKIAGETVKIEYLPVPPSFNDAIDPASPAVNVMYGLFLEERGFIREALVYYQLANDTAEAVGEYSRILNRFKKRWKLP